MSKFEDLQVRCKLVESPSVVLSRFRSDLRDEIRTAIIPYRPDCVADVYCLALK